MNTRREQRNGNRSGIFLLILLSLVGLDRNLLHADQTIPGIATVTGNEIIQGSSLQLGLTSGTPTAPGLIFTYVAASGPTPDKIGFSAAGSSTSWVWQYYNAGAWESQMVLDATNTLMLYDRSATPAAAIQLNPSGTSTFAQSLTVNGTNNLLPNQALTGPGSILTEGLGDARYLSGSLIVTSTTTDAYGSGNNYSLFGGTATGVWATAIGIDASAVGDCSMSIGQASKAHGGSAVALGEHAFAVAQNAVSIGSWAHANGISSFASGYQAGANNYGTFALGNNAAAGGIMSVGHGPGTSAAGYVQFVVGQNNIAQGDPNTWQSGDDLFIVGNGSGNYDPYLGAIASGTSSDAFTVKKNGDTSVFGNNFKFGLTSSVGQDGNTGAAISYADGTNGTVTFKAVKPASTWNWQDNTGATAATQMKLSGSNVLTIYDTSGNPAIVLDPANPPVISGISQTFADNRYALATNIVVGSSSSQYGIPGPTLSIAGGSVIYEGSAAIGSGSTSGQEGTAVGAWSSAGPQGVAVGNSAHATGIFSSALGYLSSATGGGAMALGSHSIASGAGATASAVGSHASGLYSTASGGGSTANGDYSAALTYNAVANGKYSVAAGANTTAAGYSQFVIGQYNQPESDTVANTWNSADDLFQVGNGTDATHTSNAFTVRKSGNATLQGTLTANNLVVLATSGSYIAPQGDLSMGGFTAGSLPSP